MRALHHGRHGKLPGIVRSMKRALGLLLVLGAIIGLLGIQTAAAATPNAVMTMTTPAEPSAMPADCMAMMDHSAPQPDKQPCAGITLNCIAAMGCAMPLTNTNIVFGARPPLAAPKLLLPTAQALVGNDLAPEPEPPTILA